MKILITSSRLWFAFAIATLLVAAPGCATNKTKQMESFLTASGFKQMSATNAEQERQLQSLPQGRISLVKRNGQTYYMFPNRAKNVLFIGQRAQYQNFQNLLGDAEAVADDKLTHTGRQGAVDPMGTDSDSTPGFDGPGGFDF